MYLQVMIFFNNRLFRGNRCSKLDSGAFDAFWSPNMEPLAKLDSNIKGISNILKSLSYMTVCSAIWQFI